MAHSCGRSGGHVIRPPYCFVSYASNSASPRSAASDPLTVNLTRSLVAELLGWSLTSVKSAVAELRELNLIQSNYARFVVVDVPGLRKLAPNVDDL